MKILALLTACLLLGGCIQPNTPKDRLAVFDPAEYEPYSKTGTGSIVGQAFLVTSGGDVKTGAGREVFINPVTTYSTEWYERGVKNGENLKPADPRVPLPRTSIADGDGRFRVDGLPAGEYYVVCGIFWRISQYDQSGGVAHARVKVQAGQATSVVVTR